MGNRNSSMAKSYPSLNLGTAKCSNNSTNKNKNTPSPRKHSESLKMNRRIATIVKEIDVEIDFWTKELRLLNQTNQENKNNEYTINSIQSNKSNNVGANSVGSNSLTNTYNSSSNNHLSSNLENLIHSSSLSSNNNHLNNIDLYTANLQRCISMKEALLQAQITGKTSKTDIVLQKGLSLVHDILTKRNTETVQEINHLAYEVDKKRAELKLGEEVHSHMIAKGTGSAQHDTSFCPSVIIPTNNNLKSDIIFSGLY